MTRVVKLEMKGFKSFAKNTEMFFGDDFNVVIGPNGSGKSNVIDALTFVLGKSSAKGLRAEKSANLIYNGGKTKNPAKEGEVSIYFDNEDKTFPTDSKIIKVTRIVKSNGQSVYKINDKKHTRIEVIDFLHYAKINPDAYNIILQGDITRFVEMGGDQRRAIIEQIADISVYEEKKHKAMLELEKVEQSLKEASIILKERKVYLTDLSKEKEQAEKYNDLESNIKKGRATIISRSLEAKTSEIDKIHEKNKSQLEKRDELQKIIDDCKVHIKTKKEEIVAINKEIETKGNTEQVAMHKTIENLRIDVATNKHKIESFSDEVKKIQTRKESLSQSLKEISKKGEGLIREIETFQKSLQANQKSKSEFDAKIQALRKKHKLEGANEIELQLDTLDVKIEEEQSKIDALRATQQETLREKDRLELQIQSADEKIEKVLSVSTEHKRDLEILKQKKVELKKATVELSQLLSSDSQLASQVANARSKVHFLEEEIAKINVQRASIQETLGGSNAIQEILDNKKKFGGVYGTIASLGSVNTKFQKALEIAAGNKIKGIVVEDDSTAQKCIQYLKSNKLGVAMFLPLNKVKAPPKKAEQESIAKKANGFAIDLVKFDRKFQKAFANVFGSTIIVDDISQARKIGIGAAKMVTLEGDVAETSGIMQGGFRGKQRGGLSFSNKEVSEKSEKAESDLMDAQSVLSNLESKKNSNIDSIDRLRELKATLEGEVIKMENSLHLDTDDLQMSKELKREFQKELKEMDITYDKLINDISVVNRSLAMFKVEKQKLRSQINEIRNPTKLAELNTFEEKLRQVKEEIIKQESEIKHLTNQKKNILDPEVENTQKIIKQHEKEESEFKGKITLTKETMNTQVDELKDLEVKEKEFMAQFKESFARRDKLSGEVEKLEDKTIKKEDEIRSSENRLNIVNVQVAKLQAEVNVLKEEFEEYTGIEIFKSKPTEEVKKLVYTSEQQLKSIGPVNMKAVQMYDRMNEEFEKLLNKREVLTSERENVLMMINEIEVRKKDLFLLVFDRLNKNFQRIFQTLSTKGEAYLELEQPNQPFEGGVNVKVKLSGKKFMDIRSLSGGEKTMTALAFIFAIQENEPASFYIMDEVDAALDKRNAEKLAELIQQYCKKAQYIVISHNDGVINAANNLYGVSMDQQTGVSKVVSLKL